MTPDEVINTEFLAFIARGIAAFLIILFFIVLIYVLYKHLGGEEESE
ncbi:MAG: hypothetical protein ACLFTQ_03960 [Candidatus Aenigmatarchaeota archaeon]